MAELIEVEPVEEEHGVSINQSDGGGWWARCICNWEKFRLYRVDAQMVAVGHDRKKKREGVKT